MMAPASVSEAAEEMLTAVVRALAECHGQGLTGVYRHGSLVTGEWVAGRSAVDLLVVRTAPLDATGRATEASMWLDLSERCGGRGVEVHELVGADLATDCLRYDFHFSEGLRSAALQVARGAFAQPPFVSGRDPELAGYLAVARLAPAIYGPAPTHVLPEPSRDLVLAGFLWDIAGEGDRERALMTDLVLNACRTLVYANQGVILSKEAGGRRARQHLPAALRPAVCWALSARRAEGNHGRRGPGAPPACAMELLTWVAQQVTSGSASPHRTGTYGPDEKHDHHDE